MENSRNFGFQPGYNPQYIASPQGFNPQNISNPQSSISSNQNLAHTMNRGTISSNRFKIECLNRANVFSDLQQRFGCEIKVSLPKIHIGTPYQNLEEIKAEIKQILDSLPFDEIPTWKFLGNSGVYENFDDGVSNILESSYKQNYLVLLNPSYVDYTLSVAFERINNHYDCFFAKIGGVHYQRRKVNNSLPQLNIEEILKQGNADSYNFDHLTTRPIKRCLASEPEKNLILPRNYSWEWLHETQEYRPYEEEAMYLIEHAYNLFGRNPELHNLVIIQGCNGVAYQIFFKKMIQFNEVTRFARSIRRIQI